MNYIELYSNNTDINFHKNLYDNIYNLNKKIKILQNINSSNHNYDFFLLDLYENLDLFNKQKYKIYEDTIKIYNKEINIVDKGIFYHNLNYLSKYLIGLFEGEHIIITGSIIINSVFNVFIDFYEITNIMNIYIQEYTEITTIEQILFNIYGELIYRREDSNTIKYMINGLNIYIHKHNYSHILNLLSHESFLCYDVYNKKIITTCYFHQIYVHNLVFSDEHHLFKYGFDIHILNDIYKHEVNEFITNKDELIIQYIKYNQIEKFNDYIIKYGINEPKLMTYCVKYSRSEMIDILLDINYNMENQDIVDMIFSHNIDKILNCNKINLCSLDSNNLSVLNRCINIYDKHMTNRDFNKGKYYFGYIKKILEMIKVEDIKRQNILTQCLILNNTYLSEYIIHKYGDKKIQNLLNDDNYDEILKFYNTNKVIGRIRDNSSVESVIGQIYQIKGENNNLLNIDTLKQHDLTTKPYSGDNKIIKRNMFKYLKQLLRDSSIYLLYGTINNHIINYKDQNHNSILHLMLSLINANSLMSMDNLKCLIILRFLYKKFNNREIFDVVNIYGETVLHVAVKYNHELIIQYIIENSQLYNITNVVGQTYIHYIGKYCNNIDIVKIAYRYTPELFNKTDINGKTILLLSLQFNNYKLTDYLLEHIKMDIDDSIDIYKNNVLHYLYRHYNSDIDDFQSIITLINIKELYTCNYDGLYPYDYCDNENILKYLSKNNVEYREKRDKNNNHIISNYHKLINKELVDLV